MYLAKTTTDRSESAFLQNVKECISWQRNHLSSPLKPYPSSLTQRINRKQVSGVNCTSSPLPQDHLLFIMGLIGATGGGTGGATGATGGGTGGATGAAPQHLSPAP
jgi:hypothetical protein